MRLFCASVLFVIFSLSGAAAAPPLGAPLRGFSRDGAAVERRLESTFLDIPSAQGALDHAAVINSRAHFASSSGDYALAVYMRDRLRDYGFEADLEPAMVRIDRPRKLILELTSPEKRGFDLRETPDASDGDTARAEAGLPFNYGSGDGDVRAPLVYANHGLDEDYAALARARIEVRGAIVLIRYGAQFRGLLAERAVSRGAAGVIFYSDPKEDGYSRGAVYPNGPWRPQGSVQRGMVSSNVLAIPTLPVSAGVATQLLASLKGAPGPAPWAGALPVAYPFARGPGIVHLKVQLERRKRLVWNTVARLAGTHPDYNVILGGHRDAWAFGVTDNGAGISTLLEAARGLGYLYKNGWRPKRTIVIAGWDGEEIGEVGSRAFVKANETALRAGCVAYINADENVTGNTFSADAAAALSSTVISATHDVLYPGTMPVSVYDAWLAAHRRRFPLAPAPNVAEPGGGSDHEAFLIDLGVPSANFGFTGPFGGYHSTYDDLKFATQIIDPGFALHRAAAQLLGVVAMRLGDAETVPYEFAAYTPLLRTALAQISRRTGDPGVASLRNAVERFVRAAAYYDQLIVLRTASDERSVAGVQGVDTTLYGTVGYQESLLPAVSAAIERGDGFAVSRALQAAAASLDRTAALLSRN